MSKERNAIHPKGPTAPMPMGAYLDEETDRRQAQHDAAGDKIFTFKTRTVTLHDDRIG